ncbi:MAG: formate dehydrogenase subunit gamma [Chloroflexota bacterium]
MTTTPRTTHSISRIPREFLRFSLSQRAEHALLIVSFTMLSLTGIPQKFHTAPWAEYVMGAMGGIETVRQLHHLFAALFLLESLYHVGYVAFLLLAKRRATAMLPGFGDLREAVHLVLHYVGIARTRPRHDRFDFRQKFEYWGIIWGGAVMILTGIVIWFPLQATQILPGQLIPAAKAAHGGEALLAVLTIITWHMYGAHLTSHAFPFDKAIFTGKISAERMLEEHPREYERLVGHPALLPLETPEVVPAAAGEDQAEEPVAAN